MLVQLSASLLFAQESEAKLEELMAYKVDAKSVSLDYNPFISKNAMGTLTSETDSSKEEKKEFVLLSIMNQKAFISGKWYSVGDQTIGGKILSIKPTGVELSQNGKRKALGFEVSKNVLQVKDSSK